LLSASEMKVLDLLMDGPSTVVAVAQHLSAKGEVA
jgi:hypothetical protein